MTARAAYLHVPFCRRRCGYCDFAIVAGREDLVEPYLRAMAVELSWLGEPKAVDTLYFGGGTPTQLGTGALARLCDMARERHPPAAGYEWTVEANPEDLTTEQAEMLAGRGVTRISLGVQSFDDERLRVLDRAHSRTTAMGAVELVQRAGLSAAIDLMFAAPGETLEDWRRELQDAVDLAPDHISTYGLTFERGTRFTIDRDRGLLTPADEELERAMYAMAIDVLTGAGYEHYEVSNFALPGLRSRHNETYWAGREYFAAGPGAARYVGGVRETNHRSTTTWLKRVLAGESPVAEREQLCPEARARERLVFGLRRMEGVDRGEFTAATGYRIEDIAGGAIEKFRRFKLIEDEGGRIRLTREGLFVSDAMWPEMV